VAEVTILAVILAVPMIIVTLVQIANLGPWWKDPLGRVIFGGWSSSKFWQVCFLTYVTAGVLIDGVPRDIRIWINLFLAVGILLQATLTALGLRRYKRNWPKMERQG